MIYLQNGDISLEYDGIWWPHCEYDLIAQDYKLHYGNHEIYIMLNITKLTKNAVFKSKTIIGV